MKFIIDLEKVCSRGKKNNFCLVEDENGNQETIDYKTLISTSKGNTNSWIWRYGKYAHLILYLLFMRAYNHNHRADEILLKLDREYYENCLMIIQNRYDPTRGYSYFDNKHIVGEYISKPLLLIRSLFEYVGSKSTIEYSHDLKEYYSDKSFTTNELVLIAKDTFEFINTNNIEDVIEQVDYMCEKTIDFESMLLINYFLEKKKGLRYGISIAGLEEYADRIFSNTSKLYDTLGEAYQNDTIDDRKWELVKILQDDAWELATILGDIENYIRENAEDYNKIIERKKHLMEGNQLNSHNCAFDTP